MCTCMIYISHWFHHPLSLSLTASQPFIEKKGFLYKMGGKRKNWNLRYFVLRPGVFTYSKNPSTKLLGEVKLKNLQVFFPGAGEYPNNNGRLSYPHLCVVISRYYVVFENLVLNLWAQSIECIGSCTEIVPIARACMYYFHAGSLR